MSVLRNKGIQIGAINIQDDLEMANFLDAQMKLIDKMRTISHTCQCGFIHTKIPHDARPQRDINNDKIVGYYWECKCGSTMYKSIK